MRLTVAALLLAAIASPLVPAALAQSVVDFSEAPKPGLTYRVVDQRVVEYAADPAKGAATEEKPVKAKPGGKSGRRSHTCHTAFTQTIQAVRGGEVVALEREFHACFADGPFHAAGGATAAADAAAAKARRIDFRGLKLRAMREGDDGRWRVEQQQGERWGPVKGRCITRGYDHLDPRLLRHPIIPLPRSRVQVGDTWQFDFACDQTYFPCFAPKVKVDTPGWNWTVTYRLERIRDYQEQRCAVIAVKAEVRGRDAHKSVEVTFDLSAHGTVYYSLTHRIVIAMDMETDTESWWKGKGYAHGGAGTERRTVTVEVLEAGKPTAGG